MPNAKRGEVWQVDFGLAAKVRPALELGCDIADEDRVLVASAESAEKPRFEPPGVGCYDEKGYFQNTL
jgi:hypothetical protein